MGIKKNNIIGLAAGAAISFWAYFFLATFASSQQKTRVDVKSIDIVKAAADAREPLQSMEAYEKLFREASSTTLEKCKNHPNASLALQVRWNEILLTIPEKKQARVFRIDSGLLNRFLGFLEGRLRITPPDWWEETFLSAKAYDQKSVFFRSPDHAPFYRTEAGFLAPIRTSVEKRAKEFWLEIDGKAVRLPKEILRANEGVERRTMISCIDSKRCYLAMYGAMAIDYPLYCIDRQSQRIIWNTRVWGARAPVLNGKGHHTASIELQERALFVFGEDGRSVYLESFDLKKGTSLCRFCILQNRFLR